MDWGRNVPKCPAPRRRRAFLFNGAALAYATVGKAKLILSPQQICYSVFAPAPSLTITSFAYDLGFADPAHFSGCCVANIA
jgi:hypothetical protein